MSITLREAIEQTISLGESDPSTIAANVIARYGEEIVLAELDALEYTASVARNVLGARRRSSIGSLAKVDTSRKRDLMLDVKWLPGIGYVKLGELTADQFDLAAATYRKGSETLARYADWCEAQAVLMREQNVEFYRQVKGSLPALEAAA